MSTALQVLEMKTLPISGQKPGTSGLRKKTKVFTEGPYLHNFVQSVFDALPLSERTGGTLVLAGDGRYYTPEAGQIIIKMAAANGFSSVLVAQDFLMSTPAVSALIRSRPGAIGGLIMTASHNPGGPNEDFGIKYNMANGGAAVESLTTRMYEFTLKLNRYLIAEFPDVDVSSPGVWNVVEGFTVEVVDSSQIHLALLQTIFDFEALKSFVMRPDFTMGFDAMHGVAGPSARALLVETLGLPESSVMNGTPSPTFNNGHPDPNLTYATDLVEKMGLSKTSSGNNEVPDFGAAADGDADRNMVLGKRFFVTPSDSLAVIVAQATTCIPYFARYGVSGVARSMPTSQAVDRVAEALGVNLYEVPTGWKYFGNLMDAGMMSICGEESFGTGSDHIREKDGLWAVLAWLSILQHANIGCEALVSVESIVKKHWKTYGRNFYTRYDYENVDSDKADALFTHLRALIATPDTVLPETCSYTLAKADEFSYLDPVDGSVSANQGLRFIFTDGSRVVFRLSGTGSVGATVRMYIEQYASTDSCTLFDKVEDALCPLVELALEFSCLQTITGRKSPTVIT